MRIIRYATIIRDDEFEVQRGGYEWNGFIKNQSSQASIWVSPQGPKGRKPIR